MDEIIEKKIDSLWGDADNFVVENELTVTITLNEYRELIRKSASHEMEVLQLRNKFSELNEEFIKLKSNIYGSININKQEGKNND